MKFIFVGNQGGKNVIDFYKGISIELSKYKNVNQKYLLWLDSEISYLNTNLNIELECVSFERYVNSNINNISKKEKILKHYKKINLSKKIAVERAFTDYSMLNDSVGERIETLNYVKSLTLNILNFFDEEMNGGDIIVCQTADSLFSSLCFLVAKQKGIKVFAPRPAAFMKQGSAGGFFVNSEYLKCEKMIKNYKILKRRPLKKQEILRAKDMFHTIVSLKEFSSYHSYTSKGRDRGKRALTPNLNNIYNYLLDNRNKNSEIVYTKVNIKRKIKANYLRFFRSLFFKYYFSSKVNDSIPEKSVFFPAQFQPEESTLTQGVWYANQVALIENISKSLPFGYTLVVKFHPWGRANRPLWQYRYLKNFYNIKFSDLNSKMIIPKVQAVITISGTISMECLAFDKPCIILGKSFYDYFELFYKVNKIQDLHLILVKVLIDKHYEKIKNRKNLTYKFINSYLSAIVPYWPFKEFSNEYAKQLAIDLHLEKKNIDEKL